eukprot:641852-Prymnesium_polylepis.1
MCVFACAQLTAAGALAPPPVSPEMGKKSAEVKIPETVLGTFSCHGVEPGNRQGETHAKINQDRGGVTYPYGPNQDCALFCVFDGHGAQTLFAQPASHSRISPAVVAH